jgi:periplasmic divalent cation tolerance protein
VTGCITVYVTAPDAALAETLGRTLVEERLAACANLVPGIVSLYHWGGALQRDAEVAVLLKTRATLFEPLAARVQALHRYELPCIVAWPIAQASAPYLAWIREQTRPA